MGPRGSTIVSISGRRGVGDARWFLPTGGSIEVAPRPFEAITPGKRRSRPAPHRLAERWVGGMEPDFAGVITQGPPSGDEC